MLAGAGSSRHSWTGQRIEAVHHNEHEGGTKRTSVLRANFVLFVVKYAQRR